MNPMLGAIALAVAMAALPAHARQDQQGQSQQGQSQQGQSQQGQSQQGTAQKESAQGAARDRDVPAGAQTTPSSPAYAGRTVTLRGEIESVDREMRTITIKDKEGRISMLRASPQMRNFEDLAKGSKVVVRYAEAVLLSVGKSGAPQAQTSTSAGSEPSAAADSPKLQGVKQSQTMATVTEIDSQRNIVRLSAANGEELRMNVREKADLSGLKKGDEVSVSYIEAIALTVNEDDGSARGATAEDGRSAPSPQPPSPQRAQ